MKTLFRKWLVAGLNKKLEKAGLPDRAGLNPPRAPAPYFIEGPCYASGYKSFGELKVFVGIVLGK